MAKYIKHINYHLDHLSAGQGTNNTNGLQELHALFQCIRLHATCKSSKRDPVNYKLGPEDAIEATIVKREQNLPDSTEYDGLTLMEIKISGRTLVVLTTCKFNAPRIHDLFIYLLLLLFDTSVVAE